MSLSLAQLLSLVGPLDDSPGEETARERFRRFLKGNVKEVGQVRDYVEECLRKTGDEYNGALQDLVNYVGEFLGFEGRWRRHRFVMSATQQGSLALRYNAFMPPLQRFHDMNVWREKKRVEKLNYMHQNPVKRRPLVKPAKLGRWPWSSWRFYHLGDASLLTMDPMP